MGLNEEKRDKLTDILTRLHGVSRDVGTSLQHARALAASASSPVPSNPGVLVSLPAVQPSPTSLSCRGKAVVIESDEDPTEGPTFKKPKPTPMTVSHSSSSGRSASPHGCSMTGAPTLSAPKLPFVLQHVIKGFQQEAIVDLDGAAAREKLGFDFGGLLAQFNVLLSKAESGDSSTARSFAARKATLRE